jgi:uncharacterized coiled-coil DUF342 family protein
MNLRTSIILLAALALTVPTAAFAQGHRSGRHEGAEVRNLHARLRACHERIDRGVQTGALTHEEVHRLKRGLDAVRDDEAGMRADGSLDRHEAERLERDLRRLEEQIARLKHNGRRR